VHEDATSAGCRACPAAVTAAETVQVTAAMHKQTGICYSTVGAACTVVTRHTALKYNFYNKLRYKENINNYSK